MNRCLLISGAVFLLLAPRSAPAQAAGKPPAPPATAPAPDSHSKVLFSRSEGDVPAEAKSGPVAPGTSVEPGTSVAPGTRVPGPGQSKAADEERRAVTFTAYDLDIRVFAHQQGLAVRAKIILRNDGESPLKHLRMQLSSTLQWERVQVAGKPAAFKTEMVASDADHTGRVTEAVIDLPAPLAPRAAVAVDAMYSGLVPLTAARLEDIGTPTDVALHSDWDEVSDDLIALRGFGNVLWYPASAPPVALGDGAKYFTEMGHQKQQQQGATFQATVTGEFVGEAPNLAVINGQFEPVNVTAAPTDAYPGVVTSAFQKGMLGFQAPSLFLLRRREVDGDDLQIYAIESSEAGVQDYLAAAALADPLIHQWLGGRPKTPLAVIDLPDAGDTPFEAGPVLFLSLARAKAAPGPADASPAAAPAAAQDTQRLAQTLTHALSHAYFQSPRPWLEEGLAHFLAGEWLAQSKGRDAALAAGEPQRDALALAEPETPGESGGADSGPGRGQGQGQTLIGSFDTVYYRTKAAYVIGMLRDIAGDAALSGALRAYVAADDNRPEYFEGLLEKASGKDLRWFFDSWVYRDQGLADFSIAKVFTSHAAESGQYLVTIDVSNEGYAEAEVPIMLRSNTASVTDRVRVPSRGRVSHRILLRGEPIEVEVNDGSVPEVQAPFHRQSILTSPSK